MLGAVAGGVVEDGGAAGALEDVSAGGGDGSCGVGGAWWLLCRLAYL